MVTRWIDSGNPISTVIPLGREAKVANSTQHEWNRSARSTFFLRMVCSLLPIYGRMALMTAPSILASLLRSSCTPSVCDRLSHGRTARNFEPCLLTSQTKPYCPRGRGNQPRVNSMRTLESGGRLHWLVLICFCICSWAVSPDTVAQQFKTAPENSWRAVPVESQPAPQTQPHILSTAIQDTQAADDAGSEPFISQGELFEKEGRWGEALSLYQNAVKQQPNNVYLQRKRNVARLHFDLDRRYSDSSYIQTLQQSDGSRALQVYSDILAKVNSFYVDEPNWQALTNYGAASLELALQNPQFQRNNLAEVNSEQVRQAVRALRQTLQSMPVSSKQQALVACSNISRTVNESLGVPIQSCVYEFVSGAIVALDPYSSFMTAAQYSETMSQIEGNFVGLGVELKTHADNLEIVDVLPGGSAHAAGMIAGDKILSVDEKQVTAVGSEAAADMLRGPEDSYVAVVIERVDGNRYRLNLQRRRVDIASVEAVELIDKENGVGYIRLTNFQKTTPADFDAALWQLHREGMRSLIVDVRRNPGGLLTASVEVADRFVSEGVIVSTRGRNPMEDFIHKAKVPGTWKMPLVVLIDENSASASEIFAAAIADNQRGVVVGTQSYGKGSVQGIFPINVSNGGVRLTTAKFYSPRGTAISQRGVQPNVNVQSSLKPSSASAGSGEPEDAVLNAGLNIARRQLRQGYSVSRN